MKPEHIPNLITVFRIILVYPVVACMLGRRFDWALALFVLAGVSDAVDGFLAKYFNWQSRLGSYLDPIADKLLLVSCYVAAGFLGLVPVWLAAAVVLRDVIIVLGAVAYYFLTRPFDGDPLWISKLNTFMQLLLLVAVLIHHGLAVLPAPLLLALTYGTLLTTVASGTMYVYIWGRSSVREIRRV